MGLSSSTYGARNRSAHGSSPSPPARTTDAAYWLSKIGELAGKPCHEDRKATQTAARMATDKSNKNEAYMEKPEGRRPTHSLHARQAATPSSGGHAAPMSSETRNFAGTVSRNTADARRTLLSCGAGRAAAHGREEACTRARACCGRGQPALQPAIAARARLAHPPWAASTGPRRPSCAWARTGRLVPAQRLWTPGRAGRRRGWGCQAARVGGRSRRPAR
jgi:hypothetical protein